jgi:hypothetical protein
VAYLAGDECSEFKVRRIGTLAHRCPLMMSQIRTTERLAKSRQMLGCSIGANKGRLRSVLAF